jgi:hypothetical protein
MENLNSLPLSELAQVLFGAGFLLGVFLDIRGFAEFIVGRIILYLNFRSWEKEQEKQYRRDEEIIAKRIRSMSIS